MEEIDVTEMILSGYSQFSQDELKRKPSKPPENLHPQAAEMFIWMAAHAVHNIGMGSEAYLDYTAPVTGLALANCLVASELSGTPPDFSRPTKPDQWVKAEFRRQLMAELNLEQNARLRRGVWRCMYDREADVAHHRLARRRRASALTKIDASAKSELLQRLTGKPFPELSADELYHAFASEPEMLHFLTHTDPAGWKSFEQAMGIDAPQLAAMSGFLVFLEVAADIAKHSYWYDETMLIKLWEIYVMAYPQYGTISVDALLEAVTYFSATPTEAAALLLTPPFFLLHGKFLRNPCFVQGAGGMEALLTIAIRRNEKAWNNTLGSTLARSADTLKSLLPQLPNLKVAVRRNFAGGDVDLALYDTNTEELLICEVKTVYDKHNVDSLMHRFEEAKVNVDRVASQLHQTESAIAGGTVTMMSLFGQKLTRPKSIHKVLLTWLEPVDLTMGTEHESIMCLNFATFLALVNASGGNVKALAKTVHELRNLWLVARTRPLDLDQPELKADLEVQVSLLDRRKDLDKLQLSPLTRNIIEHMETIDEAEEFGNSNSWISYLSDTMGVLKVT